ncbi:hypothetical protein OH146_11180 [Salinibacterium sp. SYSU T00001]|uniref:hypothetical protein n=1 Tax=Homoserinimonas sedimenticola TaxID=2986805 RepID=UPI0022354BAE|nr:hypothetical protein [Salinibacterium sedimenticola]MCW4386335.1 hypothetical protein [Salinibacterium sedimenticola]
MPQDEDLQAQWRQLVKQLDTELAQNKEAPTVIGGAPRPGEVDHWAGVPEDRRNRWSQMFLDRPPVFLGPAGMNGAAAVVRRGGHVNLRQWGEAAVAYERAGFTPEQFHWLHECIRHELGERDHNLAPLITDRRGWTGRHLDPVIWSRWLALLEQGIRPSAAVTRVLHAAGSL